MKKISKKNPKNTKKFKNDFKKIKRNRAAKQIDIENYISYRERLLERE